MSPRALLLTWGWRLALLLLPITSPAFLGAVGGQVRPPMMVVAILLIPLALLSLGGQVWRDVRCRWVLIAAAGALVSACWAWWSPPAALPGKPTPGSLVAKAAVSVVMGLGLYLVARDRWRTWKALQGDLPWLLTGLALSVALAVLQMLSLGPWPEIRSWVVGVSVPFSSAYDVVRHLPDGGAGLEPEAQPLAGRANGLAYEPAYLAGPLLCLLLPLGLVASLRGTVVLGLSAFTVACLGIAVSGSRLGLVALVVVLVLGLLHLIWCHRWRLALVAGASAITAMVLTVPLHARNSYVQAPLQMLTTPPLVATPPPSGDALPASEEPPWGADMAYRLGVRTRWASATASLAVAAAHPWFGCGLGLSPYHLPLHLPAVVLEEPEIRQALDPRSAAVLNPLGLVFRVPAELGLLGLTLAAMVLLVHRPRTWRGPLGLLAVAGGAGCLADCLLHASFAMPQTWLLLAALAVDTEPHA